MLKGQGEARGVEDHGTGFGGAERDVGECGVEGQEVYESEETRKRLGIVLWIRGWLIGENPL